MYTYVYIYMFWGCLAPPPPGRVGSPPVGGGWWLMGDVVGLGVGGWRINNALREG